MSETTIHKLLMEAVEGITTSLPIAYPGKEYTPTGEYIRVTHLPNTPSRVALLGTFPLDHIGFLQLDVFQPIGRHQIEYIADAKEIADQFAPDTRLTESGVTVEIVRTWVGDSRKDPAGVYWQTSINVEYRA